MFGENIMNETEELQGLTSIYVPCTLNHTITVTPIQFIAL